MLLGNVVITAVLVKIMRQPYPLRMKNGFGTLHSGRILVSPRNILREPNQIDCGYLLKNQTKKKKSERSIDCL
jgi:hypothetical protein